MHPYKVFFMSRKKTDEESISRIHRFGPHFLFHHYVMSVTHAGQRVGMFDLHYLGVELGVLPLLKSAFHFAFLEVFTSRHLITGFQGMRPDRLLFPFWEAFTLLTLCLLKVASNLKDASTGISLVQHMHLLLSCTTFSNLPTPDLFINCSDVL